MSNDINKNRINYIDTIKGFAMLLIVFGHIIYFCDFMSGIKNYIYSFHVPIFFFISGYTMALIKSKEPYKKYVKKKIINIIYPYLTFSAFSIILISISKQVEGSFQFSYIFRGIFNTVIGIGVGSMWFLPVIFLAICLFKLIQNKKSLLIILFVIGTACVYLANPLISINISIITIKIFLQLILKIFIALSYIIAGYFSSKLIAKIKIPNIVSFVVGIIFLIITYFISLKNGYVDFNITIFNSAYLFIIASYLGSFGVLLIFKALIKKDNFIALIGINSLTVMAVHYPVVVLTTSIVAKYIINEKIQILTTTIITIVVTTLIIMIIKKYCRFMINIPQTRIKEINKNAK